MRKLFYLSFAAMFLVTLANAQKINGIVRDQQGKGLEKSTVSLLKAKDSSVVKLAVNVDDGRFSLAATQGNYLLSIYNVGYVPMF